MNRPRLRWTACVANAELCRREGVSQGIYYKWPQDFMEAGKRRLAGDALAPTLDHLGLDFSGFDQIGGLVSPSDLMSMIGDLFPITLWGRSSL